MTERLTCPYCKFTHDYLRVPIAAAELPSHTVSPYGDAYRQVACARCYSVFTVVFAVRSEEKP